MKLPETTKSKITKNRNDENVPHLEITEVVLVDCNIVNSDYLHNSRVLYSYVPNKSFGQLLDISPKNLIFFNEVFIIFSYWKLVIFLYCKI